MRRFLHRLWSFLRHGNAERELSREIDSHMQLLEDDFLARGMEPGEARLAARRAFGRPDEAKELHRESRSFVLLDCWRLDMKLGFRMLVKYPGITIIGGVALAFAFGVGALIFELMTQFTAPAIPLHEGERFVALRNWDAAEGEYEDRALHDYAAWGESVETIEGLAAYRQVRRNLIVAGIGLPVRVAEITPHGFRSAGIPPLLGRPLLDSDAAPGAQPVVVIGHDLWKRHFGGDPRVVGSAVRLSATPAAVVGVMPEGFRFPNNYSVWTPLATGSIAPLPREGSNVRIFGRLAAGASLEEAQAELAALGRRTAAASPGTHEHLRPQVMPLSRSIFFVRWSQVTAVNYAIQATVLLFGSLFFANVAMLIFARTVMREGEIVVRSALGASRARVVVQLFVEALVLAGLAAAAGLIAATVVMRYAMREVEDALQGLPFWMEASLSPRTLVYAALLTIFGALIAGVLPAMKVTRGGVQASLRDAAGGVSRVHFGGIWTAVIVIQVAVTVAFPAIIFFELRDAAQLRAFDPGFATGQYLGARIASETAEGGEQDLASLAASAVELERRLEGDPGVVAVAFANTRPLSAHRQLRIEVEGADPGVREWVSSVRVSPDFFETLVAAPVAGRLLHSGDLEEEARSVVVNESFARDVLGGASPIGQRVRYTDPAGAGGNGENEPGPWHLIVGLVPDLGMTTGGTPGQGAGIYHAMKPGDADPLTMLIRVQGDPSSYADRLRVLTTAVDPTLRIEELLPMDAAHEEELEEISHWVRIWLGVNALVLGLSLAGIYAAMSFAVSRRTREIGIRVALGASSARIALSVFRKPALQVAGGIALGSVLATAISWGVLGENVWRVATPWIIAHIVVMTAICMTACIIPARRAWRIEPTEALREG